MLMSMLVYQRIMIKTTDVADDEHLSEQPNIVDSNDVVGKQCTKGNRQKDVTTSVLTSLTNER